MPLARLAFLFLTLASLTAQEQSLGFEKGKLDTLPRSWFVAQQNGWTAKLVAGNTPAGDRFLQLASSEQSKGAGNVMSRVADVASFAGKKVRLRAKIRVAGEGRAQMWLRVDRKGGQPGAIDNMGDRPLTLDRWAEAVIELDVASDSVGMMLGVLAFGDVTVSIDEVTIEAVGESAKLQEATAASPLSERELRNAMAASRLLGYLWFFHPSEALVELERWDNFTVSLLEAALPASDDQELVSKLAAFVHPFAPTVELWTGGDQARAAFEVPDGATHRWIWEHNGAGRVAMAGSIYNSRVLKRSWRKPLRGESKKRSSHFVDLVLGVHSLVPLVTFGTREGTLPDAALSAAWRSDQLPNLSSLNRTTRLAAVAQAWNVFQHFYPYFDVVEVDWAAELPRALKSAAIAGDSFAAGESLNRLVAALQDGHGNVMGGASNNDGFFPAAVRWAGKDLVVCGLGKSAQGLAMGDAVLAIDGKSVAQLYADMCEQVSSATEGWSRSRTQMTFAMWPTANPAKVKVRRQDGSTHEVELRRSQVYVRDASDKRPDNGSELADGIVYFDMNGTPMDELDKHLDALAAAKGIVFDMRGYPGDAGVRVMSLLMTKRGKSAKWGIPTVQLPDRAGWKWNELGRWDVRPEKPHLAAKIAFLTDGRAISYAESIMGIVEAYKLGDIVGATTAGTNGNVNPFEVAGGFRISWTGMRVLKHDNSQHHGVGIAPTVPVTPTAAGIAAGRDEVLDRAVELLRKKLR
ncbi:MAG: C-terminal processing protease CtpA/Prc [Planctomycetota bacterium]|jgi:C-terminal processing protease CtpA/Prc